MLQLTEDFHLQRECVLEALISYLGKDADDLIKEYIGSFNDMHISMQGHT